MRRFDELDDVDLNLLRSLDALLRTQSVTGAGRALGLTQSAMSRALARLRRLFDDPLLVRVGQRMVLTEKAVALQPEVRATMAAMRRLLRAGPVFEPSTTEHVFRVAVSDYFQVVLLPALMARLRREAPRMDIEVLPAAMSASELSTGALDGVLDAVGVFNAPGLIQTPLHREGYRVVTRVGHPLAGALDVESFAAAEHVLVSHRGGRSGTVDVALGELGLKRHVAVVVPDFLGALELLARTDLVATLPTRLVLAHQRHRAELQTSAVPFELEPVHLAFHWHEIRRTDPVHMWIRRVLRETAEAETRALDALEQDS